MICTLGEKTCGACCFGPGVSRERLTPLLRRHRDLFTRSPEPSRLALLWHELRARRGLDLILGPLLHVPFVGRKLRGWFQERVACAFLAFRDESEATVGCLLHPTRWGGVDRRQTAFLLLSGVACGAPDYLCPSARRFQLSGPRARMEFEIAARDLDWFDYSRAAARFRPKGDSSCR